MWAQGDMELVLTLSGQQTAVVVRPAESRMVATSGINGAEHGSGQALEVQLPHRIMYVRDTGSSDAQLVQAEVDGQAVFLQVLQMGPRQYKLQHCGAQRVIQVDSPLSARLGCHMPVQHAEDFSKVVFTCGQKGEDSPVCCC